MPRVVVIGAGDTFVALLCQAEFTTQARGEAVKVVLVHS
jgi:hypothetical protein